MNNKKFPLGALLVGAAFLLGLFVWLGTGASTSVLPQETNRDRVARTPSSVSGDLAAPTNLNRVSAVSAVDAVRQSGVPSTASTSAQGSAPEATTPPASTAASVAGRSRIPAPAVAAPVATQARPRSAGRSAKGGAAYRSIDEILAGKDLADPQQRAVAVAEMKEAEDIRYGAVLARAKELGIPVRIEGPGHKVSILYDINPKGPVYRTTMNLNAAISSAANLVGPAPYNLNGSGIKVGVWDAGSVRRTHREFATNRVTNRNSSAALDDHATHVAGTIGASGITNIARGMATNVLIDSYDWNSDYAEMTSAGAATLNDIAKVPLSNHSYGYNAGTADMGRYNAESRQTDIVTYSLPYYLPFWAAGNEQDELTAKGGYQSITYNGLSKNLMTVGAVNDAVSGTNRSLAAATMSPFSSWGPADDGRIKPDIVANGVSVNSPIDSSDSSYASYSGTSMATPSASGSAALLVQLYAREFGNKLMRASTVKALLIHTADDLGVVGPDYKFGWGLMNTKAAADVIRDHKASPGAPKIIEESITTATTTRTHTFNWDGSSPIRATLAWTDPAGTARNDNDRNPVLVHNLDLRVTAPNGTVFLPYVMPFSTNFTDANFAAAAIKGTNRVDNVERVDIPAPPVAGTYTVTVSLAGSLTTNSQVYSLILTGSVGSAIPPQLTAIDPITVVNGRAVSFPVTATDPADNDPITLTAADLPGNSTFTANGSTGTFNWPSAAPNGTYTPRFTATDKDGSTTQTVTINVVSNTPPTLAPIGDKNVIVSNALTFAVTATDPIGGDPITLTAANLPAGATFNATGGNGTFTWSNPTPVGVYPVTFTATDLAGSVSETVYITVKPTPVFVTATNSAAITLNALGAASPYPSSITISNATGVVERVIVKLNGFSHTYPEDMDLILVGPQGQKSVVMGAVGGGTDAVGLNLTFDDLAAEEASEPLTSGTWKPSGAITVALPGSAPGIPYETSFTNFVGTEPNGVWRLYASDYADQDGGSISGGWSLQIEVVTPTNRPPAISVTDPAPVPVGSNFELDVTANDLIDNDFISLSADELPPGATFATVTNASTVTGKMIWNNAGPVGAYTATFRATDENGTTTRTVPINVFVPPPVPPASIWISASNNNSLTATWNSSSQANSYRLDVSANPAFATVSDVGTPTPLFSHSGPPGSGIGGTWTEQNVSGTTYLIMTNSASRLTSPSALFTAGVADSLTFQARTYGGITASNNTITVSVSTNAGTTWTVLGTRTPLSTTLSTMTPFDLSVYDGKQIAVKFETLGANGTRGAGIRQVAVSSLVYEVVPDYLPGYANRSVNTTSEVITGLQPAKTYYARVRAVGEGGTSANSPVANGTTTFPPELLSPASIWASITNNTSFVASWGAVGGATSYRLDVSANPAFETVSDVGTPTTAFSHSGTPGSGTGGTWTEQNVSGTTYLIMTNSASRLTSPSALFTAGVADSLTFQARTYGGVNASNNIITVSVSTNAGAMWTVLGTRTPITNALSSMTPFDLTAYDGKQIAVKFETLGASGTRGAGLGNVAVKSLVYEVVQDYLPGYENLTVLGTNQLVSGLTSNSIYYFRARAVNDAGESGNSPVASVTTTAFSLDPQVDTDLDGLPNMVEDFMGLNPMVSDSAGAVSFGRTGGQMFMDYRKSKTSGVLQGAVKWKIDLGAVEPWSPDGVVDSFLSDHGAYEMRRATVPLQDGETRKFLRLEVWEE
jgi:subtilisin-like proprotein convertase family protein